MNKTMMLMFLILALTVVTQPAQARSGGYGSFSSSSHSGGFGGSGLGHGASSSTSFSGVGLEASPSHGVDVCLLYGSTNTWANHCLSGVKWFVGLFPNPIWMGVAASLLLLSLVSMKGWRWTLVTVVIVLVAVPIVAILIGVYSMINAALGFTGVVVFTLSVICLTVSSQSKTAVTSSTITPGCSQSEGP